MWRRTAIPIAIAGVVIGLTGSGVFSGAGGSACSVTLSALTEIDHYMGKAGATVCLAAGTYGPVTIKASPTRNSTLTAAPGAHVVVGGVQMRGSHLTVSQLHSEGSIEVTNGSFPLLGFEDDVIEHNDIGPTSGDGVTIFSEPSTPSKRIRIAYNKIHDTSSAKEGDALRLQLWEDVEVIGNDIYNIRECEGAEAPCHTDTMQSYNAEQASKGLLVERNYVHDCHDIQGLPFLDNGDIEDVTIRDNLSLRMSSVGTTSGFFVDENTHGLIIEGNTYWGTTGSLVRANGSVTNPTVTIARNVQKVINVSTGTHPYAITEDYDIFAELPFTYTVGAHTVVNGSPAFKETATDDYRLSPNPNNIGVNFAPAAQSYGPAN